MKNNKPQAIIMLTEEYSDLQKLKDKYELLQIAARRVSESSDSEDKAFDDVLYELN